MTTLIVALAGGICVAALIGAVAVFRNSGGSAVEDRLDILAGKTQASLSELSKKEQSVLSRPLDDVPQLVGDPRTKGSRTIGLRHAGDHAGRAQ